MSSLMSNYSRYPVSFVKGSGCFLYSFDNEKYFDFCSGISVTNLGHNFHGVTDAVTNQVSKLIHTSNLYENPIQEQLASLISSNSFSGKVFFCNSGAEANEAAIKLARLYGNKAYNSSRYKIISMYNSFHGRTYAAMGATAQEKIQKGFTPMPPYNAYVPFNDLNALEQALSLNDTVAVMLELFQGEGGVIPVDKEYLLKVREICTNKDVILIFDEVQTGYGRTGELFAYQLFNIEPDIMCLSKAIANGIPMGAVVAKDKFASYFTAGTHGSTFGGGYLACAAGVAVISAMLENGFLDEVKRKGILLKEYLSANLPKDCIINGSGLLLGVKTPFNPQDIVLECLNKKLLVIPAGNNSLRIYPPLNIEDKDLLQGAEIFVSVVTDIFNKQA